MRLFLQKTFLPRRLYLLVTTGILICTLAPVGNADDQLKDLLELRGYARIGGLLEFSVYNKEEKRSRWLPINQSIDGYQIKEYDQERNEIIIQFNGLKGRIPLEASRIAEMNPNPKVTPEPASDQTNSRTRASRPSQRTGSNTSVNTAPRPPSLPPARANTSSNNRSRNQPQGGGFTSGRGQRSPDQDADPSPGDNSGDRPDPAEDPEDDSSWGSIGEPPPIPTSPPPSYNPDN